MLETISLASISPTARNDLLVADVTLMSWLPTIAMFAGIALVAALAMTIIPSRQAGNVQPAEALRYE